MRDEPQPWMRAPRRLACALVALAYGFTVSDARPQAEGNLGGIRGSVLDADGGGGIANARVSVMETGASVQTDSSGRFVFDALAPGVYSVSVTREGYERRTASDVAVVSGSFADLSIRMDSQVYEMDELVVSGELFAEGESQLLIQRQEAASSIESLGSEFFSRAGTTSAAGALKKVAGTTVVDDKYVVVRGLADRYNNTLLNGGRIPSADPDRRAVNVDLFPTKLLDSITASKTFTPDMPGDFTGGSIDIQTRKMPEEFTFSVSGKVGYKSNATFNDDFLSYRGGGVSFLGFDEGGRALPDVTDKYAPEGAPPFQTKDESVAKKWDAATQALSPVLGVEEDSAPVDRAFSAIIGDTVEFLGVPLGLVLGMTYDRQFNAVWDGEEGRYQYSGGDQLAPKGEDVRNIYRYDEGVEELTWGSLFSLALKASDDHSLSFTMFFSKSTSDTAKYRLSEFPNPDNMTRFERETLEYIERTLLAFQLDGHHEFLNGVTVDWLIGSALAEQDEPDTRSFEANVIVDGDNRTYPDPASVQRLWRFFEERSDTARIDVTIPLDSSGRNESAIKAGFSYERARRDFEQDEVSYVSQSGFGLNSYASADGTRWSEVYLDPEYLGISGKDRRGNYLFRRLAYRPGGEELNEYIGRQTFVAGYAMATIDVASYLELIAGARIESSRISVPEPTSDLFLGDGQIAQNDILPAILCNFDLAEDVKLRFAWSQTVARPTFKELAPIVYEDPNNIELFIGNPALEMSAIDNFDARMEWFPVPGSVVAGSLFYKNIREPIERARGQFAETEFVRFENFPEAQVYGIELEMRHRLAGMAAAFEEWDIFRNLEVGVNGAYIVSEVKNPPDLVEQQRPYGYRPERQLQDQPTFTLNASIAYDNPDTGTFIGLFYNQTGPRLYLIGKNGLPDIYEFPPAQIDLTIQQDLWEHWAVTLRAKNLLDLETERLHQSFGGVAKVYQKYRVGREYSIGLEYSW